MWLCYCPENRYGRHSHLLAVFGALNFDRRIRVFGCSLLPFGLRFGSFLTPVSDCRAKMYTYGLRLVRWGFFQKFGDLEEIKFKRQDIVRIFREKMILKLTVGI